MGKMVKKGNDRYKLNYVKNKLEIFNYIAGEQRVLSIFLCK